MTRSTATADVVAALRAAGCVFAEEEAGLLADAADSPGRLAALVARRVAGEPLEHVVGWVRFDGLRVAVGPGVFVPRARSVALVDRGQAALAAGACPVVLDLCCGAGALAVAIGRRVPGLTLHAADVGVAAVAVARRNLAPLEGRVHLGDLFAPVPGTLRGRFGVVLANVPYVPTPAVATMPREAREHEPIVALDGGPDGLDVLRRVAGQAPAWLAPGGVLVVETSRAQAAAAAVVLAAAGLEPSVLHDDDLGATVLVGARPPLRRSGR